MKYKLIKNGKYNIYELFILYYSTNNINYNQ